MGIAGLTQKEGSWVAVSEGAKHCSQFLDMLTNDTDAVLGFVPLHSSLLTHPTLISLSS